MDHLRARPIRPFLMIRSVTLRRKQPLTLRTRPTTRSIGREIPGPRSRVGGARRRPTPGSTAAALTIRAGEQIRRRRASQGLWGSESPVEKGEIPGSKNRRHGVGEDMGEGGGVGHVVGDPDHGAVGRAHAARLKHVADEPGSGPRRGGRCSAPSWGSGRRSPRSPSSRRSWCSRRAAGRCFCFRAPYCIRRLCLSSCCPAVFGGSCW